MKRVATMLMAALLGIPSSAEWNYPPTKRVEASDTYFGTTYKDPYRSLEDLKDKDVEAWFKAQADLTDGLLAKIPARDALAKEWMELDKLRPASYSAITFEHGRLFYKKTLGGENVGKLYYRQGWKGKEKLLFDPTPYKPGVQTVIQSALPSMDGKRVALGLSANGAEWSELRVLDVDTGKLLPDSIYPSYGPTGWAKDGKAFFYDAGSTTDIKSLDIELNRKGRLHRLGTKIDSDSELLSNTHDPDLNIAPKEMPWVYIDETCPGYVLGSIGTVQQEMRMLYAPISDLGKSQIHWKEICAPADLLVRGLTISQGMVYAITHRGATKYQLVRTSIDHPDWSHAEVVIPEAKDSIQYLTRNRDYLFLVYSNGITGRIVKYDLANGKTEEIKLPLQGSVDIECPDAHSNRCIIYVSSWTAPTTAYDFDAKKDSLTKSVFNNDVVYPGFDSLVSEEVEVPGHDGTLVPLSIIHRKDIPMDGSNSCILEGYGAYGMSETPYFTVRRSVAIKGVVVAYAHPRGGSEKGETWYKAGYKTTKPNTWKDFISCAEYLVKKGYTSPQKVGGTGTSAGGILISRAITERPDLFAAAICNVGCANAMRMEFSANGPVNTPEFGTVKDETECKALYEMDGVQHVQANVKYPALMGVGGWNDPRVAPWEPGKFVAAVQNASISGKPVLMKVNYDNGHFTEEKLVTFKNFAGQFAFLLWQTGHKDFQPLP